MAKKRVTLRDVAARAGVSTAVVSYVVNNGPRPTSTAVRARVLSAIAALDYHPHSFARGLRAQRTHTIGFIVDDPNAVASFSSPYLGGILSAFTATLKDADHYLLLYPLGAGEDLASLADFLRSGRLDGVALRRVDDVAGDDPLLALIARADVPCVCIERPAGPGFPFPSIMYDDFGGGRLATEHLLRHGHRRIAHLQGMARYASAQARTAGYRHALAAAGIAADPALVRRGNWSLPLASALTRELLALPDPPTAIFAASDEMALGALEALRALGRRVPDDCALVGFDGIDLGQYTSQTLTTIRVPLAEIGRRAAHALLTPPPPTPDPAANGANDANDANGEPPPTPAPAIDLLPVDLIVGATA